MPCVYLLNFPPYEAQLSLYSLEQTEWNFIVNSDLIFRTCEVIFMKYYCSYWNFVM